MRVLAVRANPFREDLVVWGKLLQAWAFLADTAQNLSFDWKQLLPDWKSLAFTAITTGLVGAIGALHGVNWFYIAIGVPFAM